MELWLNSCEVHKNLRKCIYIYIYMNFSCISLFIWHFKDKYNMYQILLGFFLNFIHVWHWSTCFIIDIPLDDPNGDQWCYCFFQLYGHCLQIHSSHIPFACQVVPIILVTIWFNIYNFFLYPFLLCFIIRSICPLVVTPQNPTRMLFVGT